MSHNLRAAPITIRFSWDPKSWIGTSQTEIFVGTDQVATGQSIDAGQSLFAFQWDLISSRLDQIDSFVLRSQHVGLFNNTFEVWSTSRGQQLASIKDHEWNILASTYVSGECEEGHFAISETTASLLLGVVNIGMEKHFTLAGSLPGNIDLEGFMTYKHFTVTLSSAPRDVPAFNAIMVASVKVLCRAIRERD